MAVFSIIVLPVVHRNPIKTYLEHTACQLLFCLFACFFVGCHYLLLSAVGPRGWSFITWVGWPFYGGRSFSKTLLVLGGHFQV